MVRRRPHQPQDKRPTAGGGRPSSSAARPVPEGRLRGWRLWVVRVAMVFVAPAVLLLLLEGALFVVGSGYPTSFFIPSGQPGVLTTNPRFGWHYQQETLTEPEPRLLPQEKPKGTIRIFVFGESAAMGTPDPSFGFVRILDVMLRSYFPNERFEVVNAAMRGINSHVLAPLAKECAGLAPDLFLVYMGNNEINGLYGPKTTVTFLGRHPGLIPAFRGLKQTRTAQLLRRAFGANPESRQHNRKPPTPEFYREHRTAFDDPGIGYVYANFRHNLERICTYGLQAGAGVIVSTVAVNLRDCPPLGSLHRGDLAGPQLQEWDRLYRKGMMMEVGGDRAQAVSCYEQALALDGHYAELHFRMARARLAAGDRDAARRHFTLARDWDALQLRADGRLNGIIRNVASSSDFGLKGATSDSPSGQSTAPPVRLVDAEAALTASDRCPDGVPGQEFFYEHVHLRFDGDYEVAKALFPAVVQSLQERGLKPQGSSANPQSALPSREQCARALAFTAWDEINTEAAMAKLTAQPPFTGQLEHAQRQAAREKAVAAVNSRIDEAFVQQVLEVYRQALEARPQDWRLHYNLGTLLHQLERSQEAAVQFDYVVRTFPHLPSFHVLLGYALSRAGRTDQATEQFQQALRCDSHCREAREALKSARAMKNRTGR